MPFGFWQRPASPVAAGSHEDLAQGFSAQPAEALKVATRRIQVDLEAPPAQRWSGLHPHRDAGREFIEAYCTDIGLRSPEGIALTALAAEVLGEGPMAELEAVARILELDLWKVVVANLYYDLLKSALGCTGFVVAGPAGPLHARNLDWWGEGGVLSRHTVVLDFRRGRHPHFLVVGWPGTIGCLSGMAPGRVAVTLNAVSSGDPPRLARPVVLLLRAVLDEARSFEEAVDRLARPEIASDCLLLVGGTRSGEAAVVERTPTRAAVLRAEAGPLVVTNHYQVLDGRNVEADTPGAVLAATSCRRFDRARECLEQAPPVTPGACLNILADPGIRMGITAQSMAFCPASGDMEVWA